MTAETARLERNIRWVWGAVVATVMATYYWVFFFPPRLVGGNDPDRFYHLGVSRIISEHGFPRTLPQAADLGWANYFPEKEFLFHALTGAADLVAGTTGVLLLVPALGIGILCVLYKTLSHVIRPWQAATIALAVPLVTTAMLFRITLLRPHLLAILFFTLLLFAILRGRPWLAALASAGFALSYHAFYIIILTIGIAAVFRWSDKPGGARRWQWALAGLAFGMVINPYFPSNVVMSWTHVQIALGLDAPPGAEFGAEIQPVSVAAYLLAFGFMPVLLLAVAATRKFRSTADITPGKNAIYFLFLLSLALTVLSAQTVRAAEYAVPAVILLFGYGLQLASSKWWLPGMLAALALAARQLLP